MLRELRRHEGAKPGLIPALLIGAFYDRRMTPAKGTKKSAVSKSLEQTLWEAADKMRGNLETPSGIADGEAA